MKEGLKKTWWLTRNIGKTAAYAVPGYIVYSAAESSQRAASFLLGGGSIAEIPPMYDFLDVADPASAVAAVVTGVGLRIIRNVS